MEKLVNSIVNDILLEETNNPTFIQLINAAERDGHIKGMETSAQYVTSAAKKIAKSFDDLPPEEKKVLGKSYYDAFLKKIGIIKEDENSTSCSCGCGTCENKDTTNKPTAPPALISEGIDYHFKQNIPFTQNIYRPGSENYFKLYNEVRLLCESGLLVLEGEDKFLIETTDIGLWGEVDGEKVPLDFPIELTYNELDMLYEAAKKKKNNKKLNKPMRDSSGGKAYKVYVKDPKTKKIKTVRFGSGGLRAKINDKKARNAFAARHKCAQKKDKTKAGYWSCRLPRYAKLLGLKSTFGGFW
jgi:hypothetical protein